MIGIQRNTVLGYDGNLKGAVLDPYCTGRDQSYPTSILGGILVKTIEIFDTNSYPKAIGKTIVVKDKQGKIKSPILVQGSIGTINRTIGDDYKLVLYHAQNSQYIELVIESRKNGSSLSFCKWVDEDLVNEQRWAVIIDTIYPQLDNGHESFYAAAVVQKNGDSFNYAHMKIILVSADSKYNCEMTLKSSEVPYTAEGWGQLYTEMSTDYGINQRLQYYNNAAFAPVYDSKSEIGKIDKRLLGMEVSSNSRYVSR